MSLTKNQIVETKTACLSSVVLAMQEYHGLTVADLQERAINAAATVRDVNDLAYVNVTIQSEDESKFTVVVDLSSDEGDAFHIDFKVVNKGHGKLHAKFLGSKDVSDG